MKTLFIFLDLPYRYFVADSVSGHESDKGIQHINELAELVEIRGQYEQAIGIIAGEHINLCSVDLPVRSAKKAKQVIPFALEDQLVSDIEDLKFILLDFQPKKTSLVAVVSNEVWSNYLKLAGDDVLQLNEIIPDFALLQLEQDQTASLFYEEQQDRVLIKQRDTSDESRELGLALQKSELVYWCNELEDSGGQVHCNNKELVNELASTESLGDQVFYTELPSIDKLGSKYIERDNKSNLSLYQATQHDKLIEKVKPWLFSTAGVLCLSLLLVLGFDVFKKVALSKQNKQLDQQIEAIFKDNFPEITRVVDAKDQFESALARLQGSAKGTQEFLFLLDNVSKVMLRSKLEVSELYFNDAALDLVFKVNNFSILDDFKEKLDISKVTYEQVSSNSQDGKVTAKYRFKARGDQ